MLWIFTEFIKLILKQPEKGLNAFVHIRFANRIGETINFWAAFNLQHCFEVCLHSVREKGEKFV